MYIYWNKRKRLHKKGTQLPEDWFGTPTWPPFHCFGTPIWPPWRHVKTLYSTTRVRCVPWGVCVGGRGGGTLSHKLYSYVQPPSGRGLCAVLVWKRVYTLPMHFGLAKSGIVFERTTGVYERIHRFNLQMSKKEREIWINNMDKRKLCLTPFSHTSLRIHSHCATESWRAYL